MSDPISIVAELLPVLSQWEAAGIRVCQTFHPEVVRGSEAENFLNRKLSHEFNLKHPFGCLSRKAGLLDLKKGRRNEEPVRPPIAPPLTLPAAGEISPAGKRPSKVATAIAILSEQPGLTNEQIAEMVPCHPKTLSNSEKFRAAREAIKSVGQESHRKSRRNRGANMEDYDDGD